MPSPLIQNMIERYQYPVLNEQSLKAFTSSHPECVLFFTENPARFPESNDVAMILPELAKHFDHRFSPAVIDPAAEKILQTKYGFREWPTLVFLRGGEYLGAISRVQDWSAYIQQINQVLSAKPARDPGFAIPVEHSSAHCS